MPFGGNDRGVDRPRRGVGVAGEVLVDESLVVTEVEVGFTPVVGYEDLTVLERVHGAWVDVDVRIQLLDHDPEATLLEEAAQGGGGKALAERTRHTARHEYVFRHGRSTYRDRWECARRWSEF